MKKTILMITLLLGVLTFSSAGVLAQNQNVTGNVSEVIEITVNNLDFGVITPGSLAGPETSTITLGANNNVNLTVTLSVLNAGANGLFNNMIFDFNGNGIDDDGGFSFGGSHQFDLLLGNSPHNMNAWIDVPTGFPAGPNNGVIQYTAAKKI